MYKINKSIIFAGESHPLHAPCHYLSDLCQGAKCSFHQPTPVWLSSSPCWLSTDWAEPCFPSWHCLTSQPNVRLHGLSEFLPYPSFWLCDSPHEWVPPLNIPKSPTLLVWVFLGLSSSQPLHLIQLITRWWSADSSAPPSTRVSRTYSHRSDDTTITSNDHWPKVA